MRTEEAAGRLGHYNKRNLHDNRHAAGEDSEQEFFDVVMMYNVDYTELRTVNILEVTAWPRYMHILSDRLRAREGRDVRILSSATPLKKR